MGDHNTTETKVNDKEELFIQSIAQNLEYLSSTLCELEKLGNDFESLFVYRATFYSLAGIFKELSQVLKGRFYSVDYINEKCNVIKQEAKEIQRVKCPQK